MKSLLLLFTALSCAVLLAACAPATIHRWNFITRTPAVSEIPVSELTAYVKRIKAHTR